MYQFFVDNSQISDDKVRITGSDVNHIKNVLRIKKNEKILISNGQDTTLYCIIDVVESAYIVAKILERIDSVNELKLKTYLFQGLPKMDKFEMIIQKAVELGVYEIIPVVTMWTVVKIDDKKEQRKVERWNSISQSAAKQSNRGIIPRVTEPMTYNEALEYARRLDKSIIPYEKANGIDKSRELIYNIKEGSLGIFIGPEGGFDEKEIDKALEYGVQPVTLGKRILRTETAGLAVMSVIMFNIEED